MNYNCEIVIELPVDRVIEFYRDQENIEKWYESLLGVELLEGVTGEIGSKTLLKYSINDRQVDFVMTIVDNNFPTSFSATYEAKGIHIFVDNCFIEINKNRTKLMSSYHVKCSGLLLRFVAAAMPFLFKRETNRYLVEFKKYVEKQQTIPLDTNMT